MNDNPRPRNSRPRPRNLKPRNLDPRDHLPTGSWNPFAAPTPQTAANGLPPTPGTTSGGGGVTSGGGGGGVLDEFVGNDGRGPHEGEAGGLDQRVLNPAREFRCYSEHATDLRMIDLRRVNGSFTALPYHYLETLDFRPSEGIVMRFSMATAKITGYRLHAMYRALLGYRVGFVQALGDHFMPLAEEMADGEDGEPVVEGIAIETAAPGN